MKKEDIIFGFALHAIIVSNPHSSFEDQVKRAKAIAEIALQGESPNEDIQSGVAENLV